MIQERLTEGWRFRHPQRAEWYPATVPGGVHLDLLHNRLVSDPFWGTNESQLQWIGTVDWEYALTFEVGPGVRALPHVDLVFDGLDTYATVLLNGTPVLDADNMFRRWRVDVSGRLAPGPNELRIRFRSPITEALPLKAALGYELPAANDLGEKTSPFTRKSPSHFGWDWGPRLVTAGIWRDVRIEAYGAARIADVFVEQRELTDEVARLVAHVELAAATDSTPRAVTIIVDGPDDGIRPVEREVVVAPGVATVDLDLHIDRPARWWPAGYGEQPLYRLRTRLVEAGVERQAVITRIGLRTLELVREPDEWGTSFAFEVNGVRVFAKGANWIPADSFPTRVTRERYEDLLGSARAAHMNMVRVWGGGFYEQRDFYEVADELGLLVWQDLMFACSMYPGDEAFVDNVRAEVADNVRRLRNHPSIALWCGNNEIEAGWRGWGWQGVLPEWLWADYQALFERVLPEVVAAHDPARSYWPSSPGTASDAHPLDPDHGDMHYWGVWHGREPFSTYEQHTPRFMSEYGFQSFPEIRTIRSFASPDQFAIESPVMLAHQKNARGNQLIREYLLREYQEPKDFESFLYVSQVLQAEGIKACAEHLRRSRPRTMGSLYWQLNDCWPVASWSSIDYYGRWKALHYYARRFYDQVVVSIQRAGDVVCLWVISDALAPMAATLEARLVAFDGCVLWHESKDVAVEALSSHCAWNLQLAGELDRHDRRAVFLQVELVDDHRRVLSESRVFFEPTKGLLLEAPRIEATVATRQGALAVSLVSSTLARHVALSTDADEGRFSDNFFDIVPGRPVEVTFAPKGALTVEQLRQTLVVRDITSAF